MQHDAKATIAIYPPPLDTAGGITWITVLQSRRVFVYAHDVADEVGELAPVPGLDLAIPAEAREPNGSVQAHLMSLLAQLLTVCCDGHRFDRLIILGDDDKRTMFRRYCDARIRQLVVLEDRLPAAEFIRCEAGHSDAAPAEAGSCALAIINALGVVR